MSMFIERGLPSVVFFRDVIACVATGYGKSLIKRLLPLVRSCSLSKRIVPHAWPGNVAAGQKITPIPVGCTESRTAIFLFLSDSDVLLGTDECRSSLPGLWAVSLVAVDGLDSTVTQWWDASAARTTSVEFQFGNTSKGWSDLSKEPFRAFMFGRIGELKS